jgi:uncharacterized protein YcbK (DUF882 family)
VLSALTVTAAAIGALQFVEPLRAVPRPFERTAREALLLPPAAPTRNAFGKSGEVRIRIALPGEPVEYPLEVQGDASLLSYQWVRLQDSVAADSARTLGGASLEAPDAPGFYKLALVRGVERQVIDALTIAVLVPFKQKTGSTLEGYRIGTYLAERIGGDRDRPEGFVRVDAGDVNLPVTKHLRIGDFLTRDGQHSWPRYLALEPRLLDKLELVVAKVAELRGDSAVQVAVDVHSGFRTPAYNRRVPRAARDSRHQYGDAADIAIDANGDGRFTAADLAIVTRAVDSVEQEHPELVGGLGLYSSRRYNEPYAHIDARGRRARWRS